MDQLDLNLCLDPWISRAWSGAGSGSMENLPDPKALGIYIIFFSLIVAVFVNNLGTGRRILLMDIDIFKSYKFTERRSDLLIFGHRIRSFFIGSGSEFYL